MSCSVIDLKAYFLGEFDRREKAAFESHIGQCPSCREELECLQSTQAALFSLPEEEVPRRIAFVSDRVFEPRWWQTIWRSGPVMGFASALVLAAAILVHGFARPTVVAAPAAIVDTAQIEARLRSEIVKAVADVEAREQAKTAKLIQAMQREQREHRTDLIAAEKTIGYYQNQLGRMMVAYNKGGSQ